MTISVGAQGLANHPIERVFGRDELFQESLVLPPTSAAADVSLSDKELRAVAVNAKRLFVSLELPPTATQLLADLDPRIPGVRWLQPTQMHLTLGFLGDVSTNAEEILKRNLSAVAWKAFFLPIIGLGKFPGKGPPSVLWIGVGKGHPHLFQLHKRIQEAALTAGLQPDLRAFHPHITVARCRDVSESSVRPFLQSNERFDAGMIHVEAFCLNSSDLAPAGSVYTHELVCPSSKGRDRQSPAP